MSRYRRLDLPFPYKYLSDSEWWLELLEEEKHFDRMLKMPPVFGRDGWYYDRERDVSWIETCRGCWQEQSPEMFKHCLSNYLHKRVPNKAIEAIKVLMGYNVCPKSLIKLMWKEQHVRQLEDTYRSSKKWARKTLKHRPAS